MGHHLKLHELHAGSNDAVIYSIRQEYDGQKRPYKHPLPFTTTIFQNVESIMPWFNVGQEHECYNLPPIIALSERQQCVNKAYDSFKEDCASSAQGANNLLEMGGNFASIAKHATTLTSAYKNVRKGNVAGALQDLGVLDPKKKFEKNIKKRAMQASDIWLELHFGWVPLVKDIGTSIEAIQKIDLGGTKVRRGTTSHFSSPFHIKNVIGHNTQLNFGNYGQGSVSVKMQALVVTSNPNALLANQLGFVNPLSVAWEAVPFSFVVDWFSNVGQVLGACTDFVGLSMTNAFTSTKFEALRSYVLTNTFDDGSNTDSYESHSVRYIQASRSLGIEGPSLALKPFKGFSPVRAATAISLLVQQLRR